MGKARIGIFCIGLSAYWEQFEGLKEQVLENYKKICKKMLDDCQILSAGLVDNFEKAKEANQLFQTKRVELIFCYCATYSPSSNVLPVIQGLDVPVVVLNLQPIKKPSFGNMSKIGEWLATLSCAGAPEVTAVLLKNNVRFGVVSGSIERDPNVEKEIFQWCQGAKALDQLKNSRIGVFGHAYPGMMDLYVDETKIYHTFGAYTEFMELHQIKNQMELVTEKELQFFETRIMEKFELSIQKETEEFKNLCRVCGAIYRVVKAEKLDAIVMHYAGETEGEYENIIGPMNIVFSILISMGIPCCVEGDIKTAIAMLLLKKMTGCCATAELYGMDLEEDICLIGHSGSSDCALSCQKPILKESEVFHGKTGKGYLTQFFVKPGPVTLLALSEDGRGKYRFVAALGNSEPGEILMLGDTNTRVRFSVPVTEFVNRWCMAGPSHHCAMTTEDQMPVILKLGQMLGVEVVEIVSYNNPYVCCQEIQLR